MKAQYGILRFKKYKGPAISPIEAHNERTKEQYTSNPDIDTSRSRYNLHLVQPQGRYREEADRMIAAAHCRVRKDSVRVVEALVTASPELVVDLTGQEISERLAGNYEKDLQTFWNIQRQIIAMADYLASGLKTEAKESGLR